MKRKMQRAVHFDFHTQPGNDVGSKFDAKTFAKTLKDSHVGYINFFARCNRGFSYYPTKIGIPYPTPNAQRMLPEMLEECHKLGIGVTAYFNAGISAAIAEAHPEWQKVLGGGRPHATSYPCYNTEYGDHLLAEVKEVLELYPDIDGFFLDCVGVDTQHTCYCETCRKMMAEQGIDFHDTEAAYEFNRQTAKNMCKRIRDAVPYDKYIYFNGFNFGMTEEETYVDSHMEIEALSGSNSWGYDYFPTFVAFERNNFKESVFMTGRFHDSWGDFGGITTKEAMEYDSFYALALGSDISIGDHLHPSGEPEKGLFDAIKPIYEQIKAVEPWTNGAVYTAEIGVYCGERDHFLNYDRYYTVYAGASRVLSELKYHFDIVTNQHDLSRYKVLILPDEIVLDEKSAKKIKEYLAGGGKILSTGNSGLTPDGKSFALPEWDFTPFPEYQASPFFDPNAPTPKKIGILYTDAAGEFLFPEMNAFYTEWLMKFFGYDYDLVSTNDDFNDYRVVLLPNAWTMDDATATKIAKYIQNGGKVDTYGSGNSQVGRVPEKTGPSFFRLHGDLAKNTPDMVLRSYIHGTLLKLGKTAENLADHIAAQNVTIMPDWVYLPYGEQSGYSAAAKSGNVIHFSTKLFKAYQRDGYTVYKQIVDNALRMLYTEKMIEADLPSFSRSTLTKNGDTYLLHVLSYSPERRGSAAKVEDKITLIDTPFTLRVANAKAVYSLPNKAPIPFTAKDGTVSFTVPRVDGHAIIAIETK